MQRLGITSALEHLEQAVQHLHMARTWAEEDTPLADYQAARAALLRMQARLRGHYRDAGRAALAAAETPTREPRG